MWDFIEKVVARRGFWAEAEDNDTKGAKLGLVSVNLESDFVRASSEQMQIHRRDLGY